MKELAPSKMTLIIRIQVKKLGTWKYCVFCWQGSLSIWPSKVPSSLGYLVFPPL
jgi:hypothetical protein